MHGLTGGSWKRSTPWPWPRQWDTPTGNRGNSKAAGPTATDEPPRQLLTALDPARAAVLRIGGDAVVATGTWPVYQYVQAKVDELGYDIVDVLAAQPRLSHVQLTYPLARHDRGGGEDKPVKLTIAGMA